MKTITISFTSPTKKFQPFAWVIRKLWNTDYSHTALIFHTERYELVYHASAHGLNFMSKWLFDRLNYEVYSKTIEIPEDKFKLILDNAVHYCGLDYGVIQAIGVGIAYLLERIGLPKWNPFADGRDKWICSEWIGQTLMIAYPNLDIDLETVSPEDIYNIVKTIS